MIHPPRKDESQADPYENPMIPGFAETLYRVTPERITVLHVVNGAMDIEAILFPDG